MHTVADKFRGEELKYALKLWIRAITTPGNRVRVRFIDVFGMPAKQGLGVRWWVKWEAIAQLHHVGIIAWRDKVVKYCADRSYCEKTMKKLLKHLQDPLVVSKVIMQVAAQTMAGEPFVRATYNLEGDQPLVFTADDELTRLETAMDTLSHGAAIIGEAAQTAAQILRNHHQDLEERLQAANRLANTPEALAPDVVNSIQQQLDDAQTPHADELAAASSRAIWSPGLDYYKKLVLREPIRIGLTFEQGELHHLRQAYRGAKIFDPWFLAELEPGNDASLALVRAVVLNHNNTQMLVLTCCLFVIPPHVIRAENVSVSCNILALLSLRRNLCREWRES